MSTTDSDIEKMNQRLQRLYEAFASCRSISADGDFSVHEPSAAWNTDHTAFSEHFLQILWNERYLLDTLSCGNGASLQIIHQGDWNVAAGPDFRDAALIINGKLVRGDVEILGRVMVTEMIRSTAMSSSMLSGLTTAPLAMLRLMFLFSMTPSILHGSYSCMKSKTSATPMRGNCRQANAPSAGR